MNSSRESLYIVEKKVLSHSLMKNNYSEAIRRIWLENVSPAARSTINWQYIANEIINHSKYICMLTRVYHESTILLLPQYANNDIEVW